VVLDLKLVCEQAAKHETSFKSTTLASYEASVVFGSEVRQRDPLQLT
jgi:hypothetical protein